MLYNILRIEMVNCRQPADLFYPLLDPLSWWAVWSSLRSSRSPFSTEQGHSGHRSTHHRRWVTRATGIHRCPTPVPSKQSTKSLDWCTVRGTYRKSYSFIHIDGFPAHVLFDLFWDQRESIGRDNPKPTLDVSMFTSQLKPDMI